MTKYDLAAYESRQRQLLGWLRDDIAAGLDSQVEYNVRRMTLLAQRHPQFCRGMTAHEWLREFVNGRIK